MGNGLITILLIEDNILEADGIKEMLSKARQPEFSVQHVQNLADGLNLLQSRNFDVVLVDLGLPDSQGLETALTVRKQIKQIPIIVLTVQDDEDAAIESLHMDIQDYLLKFELNGRMLTRSIRYAVHRKRDSETLRISEERFHALFRDNPTMIVTLDAELKMLSVNPICACMLGYRVEELEGRSVREIFHEDDRTGAAGKLRICFQNPHQVYRWQLRMINKDGENLWVEETAQAVYDLNGSLTVLLVCHDITERKRIEGTLQESEELFRAVFNQAAVGIGLADPDRSWRRINRKCCDILGYTEEEMKTLSIREVTHPDDLEKSLRHLQLLQEGKLENYSLEQRHIRKDGSTVWVNLTTSMISDAAGKPRFIVGVVEDISIRKHVEEALVRAKEEWERTFDSVPDLIAILDDQCRIMRANRAMAERIGRPPAECIGLICYEAIYGAKMPPSSCPHTETMKDGRKHEAEVRYDFPGGVYLVSTTPLLDADGKISGVVHMARDITERKKAEEEINRLNADLAARAAELEDINRELETFNYTVAHDLRQPLNVISSYCQVIKELYSDKLEEECRHYLQETYEGVMRMNRLIEALLQFSKLAHSEIKPVKVDLSALAHEVATMLKQTEPGRQVDFRNAAGITAIADENLLRIVLDNLIGNAWKYTGKREEAVIEFGSMEIDGEPAYFVRDNGIGFDMACSDKLFIPFQRLPGAQECRGFGIGLATADRIIRGHGGRIWAEGEQGKGATFYFTLQSNHEIPAE